MGIPKFPKLGLPWLWGPITSCADHGLRWSLKKSCSPYQEISNDVLHATCMQGNRVNSQLLVVECQIANLTPSLSFGHNLCFRCLNGSCKPILNIFVSIAFQRYKELFNPLSFDAYNRFLNTRESTGTLIPKVGVPLGVWGSIPSCFLALPKACSMTPSLPSWPTTL